ncbi:MAG: type II secretion system GspH family protein [Oscillospiraceae bacterium]|jgi:prepilin-type N-terminal cleavage/methylation domain-containing protein|nr:type II secretion system GspH family protein [Oscillospiraceae bacterium]
MLKRLKNKQGVTLTELIVAMLVMSIIMMAVTTVFLPMYNAYVNANELAEVNTLLDNLSAIIMSEVADLTEIINEGSTFTIRTNVNGTNRYVTYFIDSNGFLRRSTTNDQSNARLVLDEGFYRNYTVDIDFRRSGDVCIVELTLYNRGSTEGTSREYVARPIGLQ